MAEQADGGSEQDDILFLRTVSKQINRPRHVRCITSP